MYLCILVDISCLRKVTDISEFHHFCSPLHSTQLLYRDGICLLLLILVGSLGSTCTFVYSFSTTSSTTLAAVGGRFSFSGAFNLTSVFFTGDSA